MNLPSGQIEVINSHLATGSWFEKTKRNQSKANQSKTMNNKDAESLASKQDCAVPLRDELIPGAVRLARRSDPGGRRGAQEATSTMASISSILQEALELLDEEEIAFLDAEKPLPPRNANCYDRQ
jgi:hypothetical protein